MEDSDYCYHSASDVGECVVIHGRIRDNASYLIITPDKDAEGSASTLWPSSLFD